MTQKLSWWACASTQQKLAQIDGGIELCLSGRHIAANVGATRAAVLDFGHRHGRTFVARAPAQHRRADLATALERARRLGKLDCDIAAAFSIFGDAGRETPLLDEVSA